MRPNSKMRVLARNIRQICAIAAPSCICACLLVGVSADVGASAGEQRVMANTPSLTAQRGMRFGFDLQYASARPSSAALSGLGLRIHYDSSVLNWIGLENVLPAGLLAISEPVPDTLDFDQDPSTDMVVTVAWFDIAANWPGIGGASKLLRANFGAAFNFSGKTNIRFSSSASAVGYDFASQALEINTMRVPDAPLIGAVGVGDGGANVAFGAPANNGGSPITGYLVSSNPAGAIDANAGGAGPSHAIKGLVNGRTYSFSVQAINALGTGPASASSSAVRIGGACGPVIAARRHGISASAQGGSVAVSAAAGCAWRADASAADWLGIAPGGGSGSGNGSIVYTAAANLGNAARTASIGIGSQSVTISQSAANPIMHRLLENADFENGRSGWLESKPGMIRNSPVVAHGGAWLAQMAGLDNISQSLSQKLSIPQDAQSATLQFWYWIATYEAATATDGGKDKFDIEVFATDNAGAETGKLANLASLSNLDASGGWVQSRPLDMSAFRGQTISLKFKAQTDGGAITSMLLDDLDLTQTSSGTAVCGQSASCPVIFSGSKDNYSIIRSAGGFIVSDKLDGDGSVSVNSGVKRLQFADIAVAYDVDGSDGTAGQAYRLYRCALGRAADPVALGKQLAAREIAHLTAPQVAQNLLDSAEFNQQYGKLDNVAYIEQLYRNAFQRGSDEGGLAFYLKGLEANQFTRAQMLVYFAESVEAQTLMRTALQDGVEYIP